MTRSPLRHPRSICPESRGSLGRNLAALVCLFGIGSVAWAQDAEGELETRVDRLSIQRKLNYTYFKKTGRDRDFALRILRCWHQGTRFSENAKGDWVVANPCGVMANGKAYAPLPGSPSKVAMASTGTWIASSPKAFYHSGTLFRDPETATQVHQDLLAFQTMAFGRAAPSKTPLRAGPRRPPRQPRYRFSPGTRVDQLTFEGQDSSLALAGNSSAELFNLELDTEPPFVRRVMLTRHPDDPIQRRSGFPPRFFVGLSTVEIEVLMSETMGSSPRVEVVHADGTRIPAALQEDRNPLFVYRFFPFASPQANGSAVLEIQGDTENSPPRFGADRAGNPIQPEEGQSVFSEGLVVDTLAPEVVRLAPGDIGRFRMRPGENEVLAKHEFPKSVLVFVEDYDQPADPSGSGPTTTQDASGIDFRRIGDGTGAISMRLLGPGGLEIPGTLSSRVNALELFLPDVYDPGVGIFPDTDGDGVGDPIEGEYQVQLSLVDEAGNSGTIQLPFGADVTPIPRESLQVSIRPIFSEPFPNPPDPLPEGEDVFVRRLEAIEVKSPDPDFDFRRSSVQVLSLAAGRFTVPKELVGELTRGEDNLRFEISRDQDGDGQDDFENPPPGPFLPPGVVDPRLGQNDGLYRIQVRAFDQAGNESSLTQEISIDTTPPEVGSAFPSENTTQYAPLRMVDVQLNDPQAASGSDGSGIRLTSSRMNLRFLGNDQTPAQDIPGLSFLHTPNPDDPTRPDFNPADTSYRLLLELVDEEGRVRALPDDGSFDGVFQLDVVARDLAGNEAMGTTTFLYQSEEPEEPSTDTTSTPVNVPMPLPPGIQPLQLVLARP